MSDTVNARGLQITGSLARFASELRYESLPAPVVREVKRALLDFMGCALLGAKHKAVTVLLSYLEQTRGREALQNRSGATIIGRVERTDPAAAAWVNGTMGHVYDFDDVQTAAGTHPGVIVVPAALAAAEHQGVDGRVLVAAMAAGYEVSGRVGLATQATHYEPGWHSTGTVGTLGAASTAINILGLDPEQANNALGAAASHAAGIRVSFGTMMKSLHAGNACAHGIECAFLARLGFTGPKVALEGQRGFFEAACHGPVDPSRILTDLGSEYVFTRKGYKLYACGGVVHPALDAALTLRSSVKGAYESIRDIHAETHPQVLEQMRIKEPVGGMQSKFSPYHAIAVTLIDGCALPTQFTDARAAAEDVRQLRQRVRVDTSPRLRRDETILTIEMADGRRLVHHVEHARGYSPDNPPSDQDLEDKFMTLAEPVIGVARSRELAKRTWDVDAEPNIRKWMELSRGA
ncbi:MAG: MmgE/PrpD family protein [Burkholderiales bacterium]|nr:MmgE/PrpD family protein [Burkholderiales bacterium]